MFNELSHRGSLSEIIPQLAVMSGAHLTLWTMRSWHAEISFLIEMRSGEMAHICLHNPIYTNIATKLHRVNFQLADSKRAKELLLKLSALGQQVLSSLQSNIDNIHRHLLIIESDEGQFYVFAEKIGYDWVYTPQIEAIQRNYERLPKALVKNCF